MSVPHIDAELDAATNAAREHATRTDRSKAWILVCSCGATGFTDPVRHRIAAALAAAADVRRNTGDDVERGGKFAPRGDDGLTDDERAWLTSRGVSTRAEQPPFAMPDRIAIDAKGYGWRVWDDEDGWSMVPTNPDNSPIPQPVTWFVPEADVRRNRADDGLREALTEWLFSFLTQANTRPLTDAERAGVLALIMKRDVPSLLDVLARRAPDSDRQVGWYSDGGALHYPLVHIGYEGMNDEEGHKRRHATCQPVYVKVSGDPDNGTGE